MPCCSRTVLVRANWGRNAAPRSARCWRGASASPTSHASRQWLLQQGWVARDRISLIGWAAWRERGAVGGAAAAGDARAIEPDYRSAIAFYPECRISAAHRLECAGADAAADRRQGRHLLAAVVQADGRQCARPQRAGADRGLSGRRSTISTAPTCRCMRLPAATASAPEHGHVGSDAEARADAARQVAAWLAR